MKIKSLSAPHILTVFLSLMALGLVACGGEQEVSEPTPKPVVAETVEVVSTEVPPTATAAPAEPTQQPDPDPTEVLDPTIDPENDGTLLKVPVMQEAPIPLEFVEENGMLVASGVGPIAPASSVNFTFTGYAGQSFTSKVEGGTFGNALLFNGAGQSVSAIEGRSQRWDLTESGEYEFAISNGGAGANYTFSISLTMPENTNVELSPKRFQIGQGVNEVTLDGETAPIGAAVFLFDGFEGQVYSLALSSESSKVVVINTATGEEFESAAGSTSLQLPALPNSGEYRIEVSSESAEPFELTVTLVQ